MVIVDMGDSANGKEELLEYTRALLSLKGMQTILALSEPHSTSELAGLCNIPPATCTRDVKNLAAMGVIELLDRKGGEGGHTLSRYENRVSGIIRVLPTKMEVLLKVGRKKIKGDVIAEDIFVDRYCLQKVVETYYHKLTGKHEELLHKIGTFSDLRALKILFMIGEGPKSVEQLESEELSKSTAYKKAKQLLERGLIRIERRLFKAKKIYATCVPHGGITIEFVSGEKEATQMIRVHEGMRRVAPVGITNEAFAWAPVVRKLDSPQDMLQVASCFIGPDCVRLLKFFSNKPKVKKGQFPASIDKRIGEMVGLGLLSTTYEGHKAYYLTTVREFKLKLEGDMLRIGLKYGLRGKMEEKEVEIRHDDLGGMRTIMKDLEFGEKDAVLSCIREILRIRRLGILLCAQEECSMNSITKCTGHRPRKNDCKELGEKGLVVWSNEGKWHATPYSVRSLVERMEIEYKDGKYGARLKLEGEEKPRVQRI